MRSIWNGSLSFGLVHIPVKLYSASREQALSFRMLDKKDHCPISYVKVCRSDDKIVEQKDIVKGYEYEKGEYVILDKADFEQAAAKKSDEMEIIHFADESDIDRRLYEKPYLIEPDKKSAKAYALLRDALEKSGKVGIARFVMHDREHIGLVKPEGKILMLDQLRYQDELRDTDEIRVPARATYTKKELDLALSLIDQLTEKFHPSAYKDTYTDELKSIIKAKAKGTLKHSKKQKEEVAPTDVKDILEMLRQSLAHDKKHAHA